MPDIVVQTRMAITIAVVTVREIRPARWDTPDGARPANACGGPPYHLIFTPVLVEVEQYVRGAQPARTLLLAADGGQVGPDRFWPSTIDGYRIDEFHVGARMIVFLNQPNGSLQAIGSTTLWQAPFHYSITADDMVTVRAKESFDRRTIPLRQLLDEIAAVKPLP
ncbi:MAG TPA: hypothetical protein VFU78_13110 [Thermomicrobiales bacterium]|nr:hypothetical protein [Thermomicrobiales bacterium]